MWGLLLYTIFNNNVIYLEFNSQHGSQNGIIANIIVDVLDLTPDFFVIQNAIPCTPSTSSRPFQDRLL